MKKNTLVFLSACALLLTACGGGESKQAASDNPTTAAAVLQAQTLATTTTATASTTSETSTTPSAVAAAAVDLTDAIAILKIIVGLEVNSGGAPLTAYQAYAADVDGNGAVELTDAIKVLKRIVGLETATANWMFFNGTPTVADKLNPGLPASVSATVSNSTNVSMTAVLRGDVVSSSAYSYSWALTSVPSGSTATLASTTAASPSFKADVAGAYVATMTITDGSKNVSTSSVTLTATGTTTPTVPTPTAPLSPTIASVSSGNNAASVNFTAASTGTAATSFTATCTPANGTAVSADGTASPISVTGLLNGTSYSCSVKAVNAVGSSAASTAMSVSTELLAANTLCSLTESGNQALQYNLTSPVSSTPISESLAFTYNWSCNTSTRVLSGNGVPNHAVTGGQFATKISAQNVARSIPFLPTKLDTYTNASGPGNAPGYALNSIKFDPATAGTCPNSATGSAGCNYAGGVGWQMVALPGSTSPWQFNFGVDSSNAHVQPNGEYHYHGLPTGLIDKRNSNNGKSMTLIGWAKDGFPIYTQYGDSSATNGSSTLATVSSGWTLKPTPDANRPSTTVFPMGHFEQDWEFTGQVVGGLDRCNGHTGATPESPTGTYHYHVTTSYPFVQRCVYGRTN